MRTPPWSGTRAQPSAEQRKHGRWAAGHGADPALHVTGPAGAHASKLMTFGQFVGSWQLDWGGIGSGGQPATMSGELHVGWVLGGHAVQDVRIVLATGVDAVQRE